MIYKYDISNPTTMTIISNRGSIYIIGGLNSILSDPYCDCKSFYYSGKCSHITLAINRIKEIESEKDN